MSSTPINLVEKTLDDRYYIKRYLNEGNFGMVFLAEQRIFDTAFRTLALKIFKEKKITRATARPVFTDSIMIARLIDRNRDQSGCNHLVHIFDIGILKDLEQQGYIAMEYLDSDLNRSIKDRSYPFAIDEAESLIKQLCMGLSVLHGNKDEASDPQPIVHRDLKPANVMFDSRNSIVKIADFGHTVTLDKILHRAANAGTIHCQAPESFDRGTIDTRADVYSLGLIFYEMLTLKHPFESIGDEHIETDRDKYIQMQREARYAFEKDRVKGWNFPSTHNIALKSQEKLESIIMKCLSYCPEDRFADAKQLLQAIEDLEEKKTSTKPISFKDKIRQRIGKGQFFLDQNKNTEALAELSAAFDEAQSCKIADLFPELYFSLGQAYFKCGNLGEAIKKYNEGLKIKTSRRRFLELANIYRKAGNETLALQKEREAKKYPDE